MVDEQPALEMVQLVLHDGREQAVGVDFLHRAGAVEMAHAHPRRALHILEIIRHREAALLIDAQLLARPRRSPD